MAPALAPGDEVLLSVAGEVVPGDVVVTRSPGGLVLHRLVTRGSGTVITRGDACRRNDPEVPAAAVLFKAVGRRRSGRVSPIPAAWGAPARRARSILARCLARLTAAPGR